VENKLDHPVGTGDTGEERRTAYGVIHRTVVVVSEFGWVRIRRAKMVRQRVDDVDL
jgi:hypothetical protein